ncbi:methylmalonyl-CoA mutase family protein [Mycobacterium sp. 050134]
MDNAQTSSGIPLRVAYGPADRAGDPPPPGEFLFSRGNFASGYRGKLWTFRQYSGFGTVEASNRRYRDLLGQGGTGLSVALDLGFWKGARAERALKPAERGLVAAARRGCAQQVDVGGIRPGRHP